VLGCILGWTQREPLGYLANSLSLYSYALGNPTRLLDPFGTDSVPVCCTFQTQNSWFWGYGMWYSTTVACRVSPTASAAACCKAKAASYWRCTTVVSARSGRCGSKGPCVIDPVGELRCQAGVPFLYRRLMAACNDANAGDPAQLADCALMITLLSLMGITTCSGFMGMCASMPAQKQMQEACWVMYDMVCTGK